MIKTGVMINLKFYNSNPYWTVSFYTGEKFFYGNIGFIESFTKQESNILAQDIIDLVSREEVLHAINK